MRVFAAPCIVLFTLGLAGCFQVARVPPPPKKPTVATTPKGGFDEAEIGKLFANFQDGLKNADSDKLWGLLDAKSQKEADGKAMETSEDFNNSDEKKKAEMEKNLGLTAAELQKLDGKGYLKSKRFLGEYHEVPGSKLEKVEVSGDQAEVTYLEEDGDRPKMNALRDKGRWKLIVKMPR
jgi:hypothetical protein